MELKYDGGIEIGFTWLKTRTSDAVKNVQVSWQGISLLDERLLTSVERI
jgi:hypothetical protein